MRTAVSVGRVGGLAVALGIGAAVTVGCADTAWADSTDSAAASSRGVTAQWSPTGPRSRQSAAVAAGNPTAVPRVAARRQAAKVTGASANTKAAATSNPIGSLFFNSTPALGWLGNSSQGANGVVTGLPNWLDQDEDSLSYSVTTAPVNGTVAIGSDGSYTYTPAEALAYDGTVDSFTITASDAGSGFHIHGLAGLLNLLTFGLLGASGHTSSVTVPVNVTAWKKYNTAPTATVSVGEPNPTTGAVTGKIDAVDAENDPLTYSADSPAKGSVTFTADGGFTYTPTAVASHAAARDGATAAELSDTFIVTIDDGRGGILTGRITVPVGPTNAAPVAGAPSIGSPVGSAGVISGSVSATDADRDTLTYSGPGTTAKGTVTIDPTTGAFTYTPNASAHGMAASTDTFTITVTDGYGGSTPIAVSVPIAALVVGNSMVHYVFNYSSGSSYWTPEAMNALQFAADKIASYIVVSQPVTLTFDVTGYSNPDSTTLASAGSDLRGFGPGYFYSVVQNKLIRGFDSNFYLSDGVINVNFGNQWSFGDDVGADQYDFVSVMMHEMMHAYGFRSYLNDAGNNNGNQWPLFDSAIVDWTGTRLINDSYRFDPIFNTNLTGGNGGLYYGGIHAVTAYGGLVPLYAPYIWDAGSSASHLDDYTFFGPNTKLMEATADRGPRVRVLSPIEQGILQDIGYTLSAPSWSSMIFIGFVIRRRRKRNSVRS